MLAATAAQTWLKARALDATRPSDSQPGGPSAVEHPVPLPAWIEAGALRILGSAGAPDRAAAELRANRKGIVPLASLFGVSWQREPNDGDRARAQPIRDGDDDAARGDAARGASETPARRRCSSHSRCRS